MPWATRSAKCFQHEGELEVAAHQSRGEHGWQLSPQCPLQALCPHQALAADKRLRKAQQAVLLAAMQGAFSLANKPGNLV